MAREVLLAGVVLLCLVSPLHAQMAGGAGLQVRVVPRVASSFGPRHHELGVAYGLQLEPRR